MILLLAIAELRNNEFAKDISDINADIGNSLSDLSDNIDHQKTIENLLLEQRNAVSSVSVDEEVADFDAIQRSFQASSRGPKYPRQNARTRCYGTSQINK